MQKKKVGSKIIQMNTGANTRWLLGKKKFHQRTIRQENQSSGSRVHFWKKFYLYKFLVRELSIGMHIFRVVRVSGLWQLWPLHSCTSSIAMISLLYIFCLRDLNMAFHLVFIFVIISEAGNFFFMCLLALLFLHQ